MRQVQGNKDPRKSINRHLPTPLTPSLCAVTQVRSTKHLLGLSMRGTVNGLAGTQEGAAPGPWSGIWGLHLLEPIPKPCVTAGLDRAICLGLACRTGHRATGITLSNASQLIRRQSLQINHSEKENLIET